MTIQEREKKLADLKALMVIESTLSENLKKIHHDIYFLQKELGYYDKKEILYGISYENYRNGVNKILLKILKFFFSKEIEVAPGVFWLGGYCYENRNKPQGERPLKFKKRDT